MTQHTQGIFVAIEGISGSGKTEISKKLAHQMPARWYATPPAPFNKMREEVDRKLSLNSRFLFYLSSVAHASWEIEHLLETQSVACDKYVWSTICYHTVYGLEVKNNFHHLYRKPDCVFLLVCDEEKRLQRLRARGPIKDMEKFNLRQEMERRCLVEFKKHLKHQIDNSCDDPQEAVEKILKVIQEGQK